jgi:hypothetical protein
MTNNISPNGNSISNSSHCPINIHATMVYWLNLVMLLVLGHMCYDLGSIPQRCNYFAPLGASTFYLLIH